MADSAHPPTAASPAAATQRLRSLGRFQLLRLLGRSAATMVWLAFDPRVGHEVMLTLPRTQPGDDAALDRWMQEARSATRLSHPNLATVFEVGVEEHWPYTAVDRAVGRTLPEVLAERAAPAPSEVAGWCIEMLSGVAFAHEAGAAHRDLQLHHLLLDEHGHVRVMGLGVATDAPAAVNETSTVLSSDRLRRVRHAAEVDVLACGLLLQHLLVGQPPLGEADTGLAIARITGPHRETVRLPWTAPHPVPEALRAIANRCTSSQDRQRYLSARTLMRALEGWRDAQSHAQNGPLALLLDRLHSVGHLPAMPGAAGRVGRLAHMAGQHTEEIAELILADIALSLELLRQVNSAQVQGSQSSSGPVLSIRRAVALVGLDGVARAAAALRQWPGPMAPKSADAMRLALDRARLAGFTAQILGPAGYDPEVVFLIGLLQNLGRLLVHYHFPDDAAQLLQLMKPVPPPEGSPEGAREQPGLDEQAASYAVLGIDIESLGAAVVRHWGFGDEVQHMVRRLPMERPVHTPNSDADMLRVAASAANEAVDAITLHPATRSGRMLALVAQRYGRVLEVDAIGLREALQAARQGLQGGTAAIASAPRVSAGAPMPDAPASSLREALTGRKSVA